MQAKIEQLQSGKEHGEERLACLLKAMIEQLQEVEKRVVALSALSEMQPARRRTEFPGDVARHIANFLDGADLAALLGTSKNGESAVTPSLGPSQPYLQKCSVPGIQEEHCGTILCCDCHGPRL